MLLDGWQSCSVDKLNGFCERLACKEICSSGTVIKLYAP